MTREGIRADAVVVYDSVYGNTELVARHIAKVLEGSGHPVRVVRAKDALKGVVEGDILFIGSPTRVGSMTGKVKRFVKRLDAERWRGSLVATFDTEMESVIRQDGASAAAKIHDMVRMKGLKVHTPVLKVAVSGVKGPLSPGYETAIEAYVKEFLQGHGA